MTEEDKRLIRLDIVEGKIVQALEKLKSTVESTAIYSKNQYLDNIDIQIHTLRESDNKFNMGVERREDNARVHSMAASFVLDNLDSLEKEISKINNDRTKKEIELKNEEQKNAIRGILLIAILVLSYFFWKDIKTYLSAQSELFDSIVLQETSKNLNISQESIKPIDNIFSPPFLFSIVSALFFYHSYLLLFYMVKLDTKYSIKNIGKHVTQISLFISSLFIGYYVNTLFSKGLLKGDVHTIYQSTKMVFYIIGCIVLINLVISFGDKGFKFNFLKIISVILCFIPYHAFCAYKGGIISKNVICVVENYTSTKINSTVKEFLDFSSSLIKTEDKNSNKGNK